MKKAAFIAGLVVSFFALVPLSWHLADPLFVHPFFNNGYFDDVLLVCPDHVEMRSYRRLKEGSAAPFGAGCIFNIPPARQTWAEGAAKAFPAPNPNKESWTIKVKQIGPADQRIDLNLLGDGMSGMIYEVKQNEIIPLYSRYTGPGGAFYALWINLLLWASGWWLVWRTSRRIRRLLSLTIRTATGRSNDRALN